MTDTRHDAFTAYAELQFAREPEPWKQRRAFGESLRPGLQMGAYEGALVAWLLKMHGAKHVLEIGSFVGVSSLWLASALPPDGSVVSIERDPTYAEHARDTLRMAGEARVQIVQADARDYLAQPPVKKRCALFLDGEKNSYAAMLEAALPHLRDGALIVADNTLLFGAVLEQMPRAKVSDAARADMKKFHGMLADEARFTSMMLPTTEGLTVALYCPSPPPGERVG